MLDDLPQEARVPAVLTETEHALAAWRTVKPLARHLAYASNVSRRRSRGTEALYLRHGLQRPLEGRAPHAHPPPRVERVMAPKSTANENSAILSATDGARGNRGLKGGIRARRGRTAGAKRVSG